MTRHITDRERMGEGGRTARYAEIERQTGAEGAHPAAREMTRRPRMAGGDKAGGDKAATRRMEAFLRIERGHRA